MSEFCEVENLHPDVVNKVKEKLIDDDFILDLSEFFKVFGDSTRMKIICALFDNELCVCDLANIINTSVSATSHQLRILKNAKLVKYRKEGKVVYYSLADEHVYKIVEMGMSHIEEI